MIIANLMHPKGSMFLKPEYNRVNPNWACCGFSKAGNRRKLMDAYQRGRDVMIDFGTLNPANTPDPSQRGRLLGGYTIEPKQDIATRKIVRASEHAIARWPNALPALRITETFPPHPMIRNVAPRSWSLFSLPYNRGVAIKVEDPEEREAIMALPVREIFFEWSEDVVVFQSLWTAR